MIEILGQDLRYAGRTFRRSPGFAALAVLTISIGVGANAAMFSIVNAVLIKPLPFAEPDRLVLVSQVNRQTRQGFDDASPANFLDWRARTHSLAGLAAMRDAPFVLAAGDHPERLSGAIVSANFFDVLGVAPAIGRRLQAADEGPGAQRAVVLSNQLWRQRFGEDPGVVGRTVRLNDETHTIVGVMPTGITYPDDAQLWVPSHWTVPDDPLAAGQDPAVQRDHNYFEVVGRVRHGLTLAQAQADMDGVALSLERDYPVVDLNVGVALMSLREDLVGDIRPALLILFAAVGLLLLIATANVSGLLIARATVRHQEIAVRVALGATRGRLVRQLLTESVMLAIAGGACGIVLAMWLIEPLVALSPFPLGHVAIDTRVLLFGLTVSTAAGLLFGVAPARQSLRPNVHEELKHSARGAVGSGQRRVRAGLVVGEIALSLVLLVAAGLTIRSFVRLQHVPTGFDANHVLTLVVNLPQPRYPTPQRKADFWEQALASLAQVPGVDLVGATTRLPLSGGNSSRGLQIDGRPMAPPASADYRAASPEYFRALGIPLIRGRGFRDDDREDRELVATVSASMAERYWPGVDPMGHHLSIDGVHQIAIVGIVGDVHHASLAASPKPTFYVPYRQDPWPAMTFALRTAAAPATIVAPVREAIWRVDRDQPVGAVLTMDERLANSLSGQRFNATLLVAFGVVAGALAAIGLYGVLTFIVAQRRREIGVRMALGATARDVVADVMGQGLRLAAVGVLVGLALSAAATRLLRALLFGTSPTDVATFASVAALLIAIAGSRPRCATAVPVDPLGR